MTDDPRRCLTAPVVRRLLVTLLVLAVSRALIHVPLPGVDIVAVAGLLKSSPVWGGGALARLSIAALGLTPYVSMWVLMEVFRGNLSESRVERIRLLGTVLFALLQGYGIAVALEGAAGIVLAPGWIFRATTMMTLLASTVLLIWLGTQISRHGLGPGIWVLYAAGFIADVPATLAGLVEIAKSGAFDNKVLIGVIAITLALVALIVLVEVAEWIVPVEPAPPSVVASPVTLAMPTPARSAVEQSVTNSPHVVPQPAVVANVDPDTQRLTFRVDHVTIVPAFLASTILLLPIALAPIIDLPDDVGRWLDRGKPLYLVLYGLLVFGLTFVLTAMRVRPDVMARRLAREHRAVSGVPAPMTERHLDGIVTRLTLLCGLYLVVLFLAPEILINVASVPFYIGGTAFLVVVLVMLRMLRDAARHASPP